MDRIHAAACCARALQLVDGVIRARLHAASALDALVLIDLAFAVHDVDGVLRADFRTLMGKASLAGVCHDDLLFRAGVACELDDVDQRIIIIFLGDRAFFDPIGQRGLFLHAAKRKADAQAQALADDGAVAVARLVSGQDLVWEFLDLLGIVSPFVCQSGDFSEDFSADVCH